MHPRIYNKNHMGQKTTDWPSSKYVPVGSDYGPDAPNYSCGIIKLLHVAKLSDYGPDAPNYR